MSLLNQIGDLGSLGGSIGLASQVGQLFFPREYKIGSIDIDTVLSESHTSTAEVTRYPTELGVQITDHLQMAPYTVTINALVSDIAGNEFADFGMVGMAKDAYDAVSGLFSESTDKGSAEEDLTRSKEAWAQLQAVQEYGVKMELVTNLRTYENMVITSLACTQDKDTMMIIDFTITLTEIVTVDFLKLSGGLNTSTSKPETETAKNNQPTDDRVAKSDSATTKKGSSILYDLVN